MAFEINGNGNVNKNLFVTGNTKTQNTSGTEKVEVNITDNKHIGEFGDKLLEQVQPGFVQASRIPETDRAELSELYAMAGIKNPKMPTAAQYASIANNVGGAVAALDELSTTTHTEQLFSSPEFNVLNDIFGIS